MIARVFPKFCPACEAPLFDPACSPITPSPARSCSSVNSRLFSVDSAGPRTGPSYPMDCAFLPNANIPFTTCKNMNTQKSKVFVGFLKSEGIFKDFYSHLRKIRISPMSVGRCGRGSFFSIYLISNIT